MKRVFGAAATAASHAAGTAWAFIIAMSVILVWAVTGPMFGFSDTWQLVINTGTTIVTFLMVFLIQNTQNRETVALHAKIDELIIKLKGADNALVYAEDMPEDELEQLMKDERELASQASSVGKARGATHTGHDTAEPPRRTARAKADLADVAASRRGDSRHKRG